MNQPQTPGGPPTQPFQAAVPQPGAEGSAAPPPTSPDSGNRGLLIAILSILGVILVGGLVAGAFFIGRGGDEDVVGTDTTEDVSTSTTASTTASTTTVAPTAPPATATPAPAGLGDVVNQPSGLFCRDLRAMGYSYSAAVDYWRHNGQPDRMDADLDGIPCETVYPSENINAYWGDFGIVPTYDYYPVFDLPGGLFCGDLADAGYDTFDALSYYLMWGLPPNMDADGDGIPCETVYADAEYVWYEADFWLD